MGSLPLMRRFLARRRHVLPFSPSPSSSVYRPRVRRFVGFSQIIRTSSPTGRNDGIRRPTFMFSTTAESILVWAPDPAQVALQMKNAVDERRLDDAWRFYEKHIHMDGFPRSSMLSALVCGLAESFDRQWLIKASALVEEVFEQEKQELLDKDVLVYLSYVLARCELPVPASTLLRKLIETEDFLPAPVWTCIIARISQTQAGGALLAAELVGEIGHLFKDNRVDPRKKSNRPLLMMKPDPAAFNLALSGCLMFGTTRKAEQLLELMPRVGVKPDPDLLIVMAHVFERNGRLGEIKKLRRHIDEACGGLTDSQFQQFYSCLLSCHLKLGELSSACDLVLGMLKRANRAKNSLAAARSALEAVQGGGRPRTGEPTVTEEEPNWIESQPPSFAEFSRERKFTRLSAEARGILRLSQEKLRAQVDLVKSEGGILHPSERIYAKLVKGFIEAGKINDLAGFLIKVKMEEAPASGENSVIVQVLHACIAMGLLEPAHDLLDEMTLQGIRVSSSVYSALCTAYCREGRVQETAALLKDAARAGVQLDSSCYESMIEARVKVNDMVNALRLVREMKSSGLPRSGQRETEKESFMARLMKEVNGDGPADCGLHDWNNVVDFFCRKRMMQDAHKALRKMRALGHTPNAQTFHSLVNGHAAAGGGYAEVADLWGEMKVLTGSTKVEFDQELLDSLLYCFVRGGFFLRAKEVAEMMERGRMFIDKYKYRALWLKYHRKLYKGKAPKIQTEAQFKRREAALTFKAWLGFS